MILGGMRMSLLYFCYSAELKNYLSSHGMRYEVCALNPNNHQMFWAYMRCDKLDDALNEWSRR